jgi:hypothetical protein
MMERLDADLRSREKRSAEGLGLHTLSDADVRTV